MPFDQSIAAFASALSDPSRPPPADTQGRDGAPDARRFAIYRNNVAVSLIQSMEARYPVTRRLVGDEFFRAMAHAYVARHKPPSPVILHYGVDFPDFVGRFEPARDLPYLPDIARLENAWVEAYHSADEEPLGLPAVAAVDPTALDRMRLIFHPAARLLRSDHPAASIWAGHQGGGDVAPPSVWRGEEALITRPQADVRVRILPAGGYAFAHALQTGATLGDAHAAMVIDDFDPGAHLVGLIESGAISRLQL